jgi:hypothetical protein
MFLATAKCFILWWPGTESHSIAASIRYRSSGSGLIPGRISGDGAHEPKRLEILPIRRGPIDGSRSDRGAIREGHRGEISGPRTPPTAHSTHRVSAPTLSARQARQKTEQGDHRRLHGLDERASFHIATTRDRLGPLCGRLRFDIPMLVSDNTEQPGSSARIVAYRAAQRSLI